LGIGKQQRLIVEDFIDELFSTVDEYYPGSKRKRKTVVKETSKVKDTAGWDARPYVKTMPNGKDMELFTLGALSDALGRPIITVRTWTNNGQLPLPPYRLPSKPDKNGKIHAGRRLYSRAMVDSAVDIFQRNGLLHLDRIEWSQHQQVTKDIAEVWNQIRTNENTANTEKEEQ
jgi:hypothetical protein